MNRYKWLLISIFLPTLIYAQTISIDPATPDTTTLLPNAGHYIVALIAGVILAVAFQLILTNLSVAAGLNVLSTVTTTKNKGGRSKNVSVTNDEASPTIGESARTISSAFGIWTLVTASIALFFASWLASELSLTSNTTIGAVLGLVIWGLFYIAMMTIEVSAVSSLVGSLVKMAATGLRTAYNMTTSVFSKSDDTKIADTAAKVAGAVREELFGDVDADDVRDQIQKYVNQLKPQRMDPHQVAMEFAKLLDQTEIRALESHEGPFLDTDTIVASLKTNGFAESDIKAIASNLNDAFQTVKREASSNKDTVSKVTDSALQVAGMSREDAENARMQIENYLRSTGKEELNPDGIKRDLEKLFSDPKEATSSLKERLSHIDRQTVASIIAQRQDISQEEAQGYVDRVMNVINMLSSGTSQIKDSIVEKFQNYMSSLNSSGIDTEGITHDIQRIFHDPKAGTEALMRRIKSVDRNTLKSILASRRDISEEDAERIISKIESVRDSVMQKVEQMKEEISRRLEMAKEEAVHQADEVRKTASTAAWWAFATAVVSGVASAIGGILAARTWF